MPDACVSAAGGALPGAPPSNISRHLVDAVDAVAEVVALLDVLGVAASQHADSDGIAYLAQIIEGRAATVGAEIDAVRALMGDDR